MALVVVDGGENQLMDACVTIAMKLRPFTNNATILATRDRESSRLDTRMYPM
jgi:hypothetical protein